MKIIRLPEREFWDKYNPLCKPITGLSEPEEQKFNSAIDVLNSKLEKALSDYDEEEYETSYDWNPCWHHSGGVYGRKAITPNFIKLISDVLATENHPWCFHLAIEPEFEGIGEGQIFFHDGSIYADESDSIDYSLFETK